MRLRFPSKSPASVRCIVPVATPTATIISAATSRFARSAISKARNSSTACMALVDKHRPLHVSIVGGEPLVRYRELMTILPDALEARHPHATRHQRGARDSRGVPRHPAAVDRRLDRRPAAGARRAPHAGDLRAHPQAHRRALDHGALHRDAAAGEPAGLHRGVPAVLVGARTRSARSG